MYLPWPVTGSSPLTRGKLFPHDQTRSQFRLIPAHAGKTSTTQTASPSGPAHPRSRGENFSAWCSSGRKSGSSPLTRGKHDEVGNPLEDGRLIPAHAGKTALKRSGTSPARAHPRSRGENEGWEPGGGAISGSSPLTRGKLASGRRWFPMRRLIPAHAGKTVTCGRA